MTPPQFAEGRLMPRGINPTNATDVTGATGFVFLPIQQVCPSIFNPRKEFNQEALEQLAASIKAHGVLEPVLVRPADKPWHIQSGRRDGLFGFFLFNPDHLKLNRPDARTVEEAYVGPTGINYPHFTPDPNIINQSSTSALHWNDWPRYEIVAGERRFRAALMAGLTELPCIVKSLSIDEAVEITVTENLHRSDLTPFEEARGFETMLNLPGMTQARVAERLGCSQTRIARVRGLLTLPEEVQALIQAGELSQSHGQRLLPYKDFPPVCIALAETAAAEKWPVSKLDAPMSNNVFRALKNRENPPVRGLGYGTRFDWETVCKENCPFKAYRPGFGYDAQGVCLKGDHWEILQTEALEEKRRRQESDKQQAVEAFMARKPVVALPVVSSAPVSSTPSSMPVEKPDEKPALHWDDHAVRAAQTLANAAAYLMEIRALPPPELPPLPVLKEMDTNSYRQFRVPPPGCSEACPCRALAIGYSGNVTEICTDSARLDKLVAAQKKAEKQTRRETAETRLENALRVMDDALAGYDGHCDGHADEHESPLMRQTAAVAVYDTVQGQGLKFVVDAAARLAMPVTADYYKPGNHSKRPFALAELARHSARKQIVFCAEVQLRKETADAIEYDYSGGTPRLATFLIDAGEAAQTEKLCNL